MVEPACTNFFITQQKPKKPGEDVRTPIEWTKFRDRLGLVKCIKQSCLYSTGTHLVSSPLRRKLKAQFQTLR